MVTVVVVPIVLHKRNAKRFVMIIVCAFKEALPSTMSWFRACTLLSHKAMTCLFELIPVFCGHVS